MVSPDAALQVMKLGQAAFDTELREVAERFITANSNVWDVGSNLGFFTSTIVHTLLIVDKPTDIPFILFRDQAIAFEHIHNMQGDKYNNSFHVFCDAVNKIKLTFGIVAAIGLVGLLFAVLSI